jgi:hypothetical protein
MKSALLKQQPAHASTGFLESASQINKNKQKKTAVLFEQFNLARGTASAQRRLKRKRPCVALQIDGLSSSNHSSCELLMSLNGARLVLSKKPTSIAVAPPTAKFTPRETSELFASCREAGRNGRPSSSAKTIKQPKPKSHHQVAEFSQEFV